VAVSALTGLLGVGAFVASVQPAGNSPPGWSGVEPSTLAAQRRLVAAVPSASSPSRASSAATLPSLSVIAFLASAAALSRRRTRSSSVARHVSLEQIQEVTIDQVPSWFRPKISVGMARRDAVKEAIAAKLDDTFFIMAFNKDAMPTADLEAARAMFPASVNVRCLKNSLVKKAIEGTEWEPLSPVLKGSNMYVFVMQDTDLKPSIQAYLKIAKTFSRAEKVAEIYEKVGKDFTFELKPLVGGMMRDEWNVIPPEDIPKLKDFPTKTELIARIAGSIKQVTQKVAVGVKQVPQKLAIGTKKIVEKMEEDGKDSVADAVA